MAAPRLKTEIWAAALLRRCNAGTEISAMLVRRGDVDAGTVLLKINRLDGTAAVLSQALDAKGRRGWLKATGGAVSEREADEYVRRSVRRDPDLWVIEIEDRQGRFDPDEPMF